VPMSRAANSTTTTTSRERFRGWCITVNNPGPNEWPTCLEDWFTTHGMEYAVAQKEEGAEGTPHIQAYVHFKNARAFSTIKTIFQRAHIEKANGTPAQNKTYCTKEEGRLEGPWEFGTMPEQGKRSDLVEVQKALDAGMTMPELAEKHFSSFVRYHRSFREYSLLRARRVSEPKTILVLWGSTGTGKTRYCFETFDISKTYWKTKNSGSQQFWDGYSGEEVIVVDEFYGWLTFDFMLRFIDRYPVNLEIKHGTVPLSARTIVFTSNKHPRDWYPNSKYGWDDSNPLRRRITEIREFSISGVSQSTGEHSRPVGGLDLGGGPDTVMGTTESPSLGRQCDSSSDGRLQESSVALAGSLGQSRDTPIELELESTNNAPIFAQPKKKVRRDATTSDASIPKFRNGLSVSLDPLSVQELYMLK